MTAGDVMTRMFEVVHPDALLEHVTRRQSPESGPVLVCEHGRLIGVLDPRDLVAGAQGRGRGARPARVRDVVAPDVLYCLESTDLAEAVALMRENHVEWIPVLSSDLRLAGLLALRNLPGEVEASHAAPSSRGPGRP